ncbi:MAG: RnfABCDGE type electron transport complex subunit D [Candidatus Eisenbacteria bacterium]|nr:RnfABCDGE type electron transport complex subunit D [Candidatus Eisenbacteria bacterium]
MSRLLLSRLKCIARSVPRDPRAYQIVALSGLLALGMLRFGFDIAPLDAAIIITSALAAQGLAERMGRPASPAGTAAPAAATWPSALISALSMTLLLRARHPMWLVVAVLLAVFSKFALRVPRVGAPGTKHVLNPTNGAIAILLACGAPVWVSPSQCGHSLGLLLLLAGFGSLVVYRSERSDVTLAFLLAWAAVLFTRAAWVHQAWIAPLHQLENGAVALFAFHMISDPRTTPDSRTGRSVFAVLVAVGAGVVQFVLFRTNGLLWSLAVCSLLVPVLDRVFPGRAYHWPAHPRPAASPHHAQEAAHVAAHAVRSAVAR